MAYIPDAQSPEHDRGTPLAVAGYYFWSLAGLAIAYPYLPLYWRSLGCSQHEIHTLLTALGLGGLIAQAPLGYLSDRGGKRRRFVVGLMGTGGLTMLAYGLSHSFWVVLGLTLVQSACFRSADALVQALVGDWVSGTRMATLFGRVRLAGSVGWFSSLLLSARVALMTDTRPLHAAEWATPMFLVVAGCNFAAAGSILIARSAPARKRLSIGPIAALTTVVRAPGVGRFLLAVLLFWTGLQSVSAFLSLLLQQMGAGHEIISMAFVVSAIAETPFILLAGRMAGRWGERRLLMVAFGAMPIRLAILAFMPTPEWAYVSQALHSVTYGLALVGTVAFMNHHLPGTLRASGQAALGVVLSASNTLAPFLGGFIVPWGGYKGAFAAMAAITMVGWAILGSTREDIGQKNKNQQGTGVGSGPDGLSPADA
ncbi:MAG TPA: MFS transporter [Armatimonadota bacterium]|jgi:PPP family 3-phenylpropionic acid transporter